MVDGGWEIQRHILNIVAVLMVLMLGVGHVWAQSESSDVEIETIHVAGPVYMLVGKGGNMGVSAGPDGTILIDDQFAPLSKKIQKALDAISQNRLRFVLNTHWHADHTGGNEAFGELAPIVAHTNVRKRLMDARIEPVGSANLPILTYDDGISIHLNGEEIRVMHKAHAHTDGDSAVLFTQSGVVHLGDLMFSGMFPYVDTGSGGSVQGLIKSIEAFLVELPMDIRIIPGHGPLSGYEDLRQYHEMLVGTTRLIRARAQAGQTEDEAVAAGLPEQWSGWAHAFISEEQWIRTVYGAYTQ